MNTSLFRMSAFSLIIILVSGCAAGGLDDPITRPAVPVQESANSLDLDAMASPQRKVNLAVYNIVDKTGQRKPHDSVSLVSTAVTQGADSILVDILSRTGQGSWFRIMERNAIRNLLQERKIAELNNNRSHEYAIARKKKALQKKLDRLNRRISYQAIDELEAREDVQSRQERKNIADGVLESSIKSKNAKSLVEQAEKEEKRRQRAFDKQREKQLIRLAELQGIDINDIIDLEKQKHNLKLSKAMKDKLDKSSLNERSRRSQISNAINKANQTHRKDMGAKLVTLEKLKAQKKQLEREGLAIKEAIAEEKKRHLRAVAERNKKIRELALLKKTPGEAEKRNVQKISQTISGLQTQINKVYQAEAEKRKEFSARIAKVRTGYANKQKIYQKFAAQITAAVKKTRDVNLAAKHKQLTSQLALLEKESQAISKAEAADRANRLKVDEKLKKALGQIKAQGQALAQLKQNIASGRASDADKANAMKMFQRISAFKTQVNNQGNCMKLNIPS